MRFKINRFLVRYRNVALIVSVVLTGLFAWAASTLKLYDDPNHWPPENHPYVRLNSYLQERFGGANMVTIMISRNDGGSIVHSETLAAIKRITDQVLEIRGVIPYAVRSLSTVNARYLKGSDDMLDASLLFEDATRAPETPEELERTEFGIENNRTLGGMIVSPDMKSVIIQADFRTGVQKLREGLELPTTDPISIYKEIESIIEPENNAVHRVTAAGSPIIIGWVNSDGLPYIWRAFLLVFIGVALVLVFAFRSTVGILPPLLLGVVATFWAFGLQRVFEGEVLTSSAALLAPFIIMAAAASHSVLFIKRFLTDELGAGADKLEALARTLDSLLAPMAVALLTDLIAFIVLSFVPFDNVRVLGQVTAFGLFSLIILVPSFVVPLLALWPEQRLMPVAERARSKRTAGTGIIYTATAALVRPLVYNGKVQALVLVAAAFLTLLALTPWFQINLGGDRSAVGRMLGATIDVGQDNTYAIHNYLTRSWRDNEIYNMEMEIKKRFGAVYTLSFLAQSAEPGGVKTPHALRALEQFSEELSKEPEVAGVVGLPLFIKVMNRFMNSDQDEYFEIPDGERAQMAVNEALYFYTGGTPGAFDAVVDPEYQRAMMVALVTDTSHATVQKLLDRSQALINKWDERGTGVTLKMAGGSVGIAGAFNESIRKWLVWATGLSALASFVAAAIMLRSLVGPFLLLLPLALGIIVWMALIYLIGIEFNSNVTSALAIASGVGIDAEVYLLFRFREEYLRDRDFRRALFDAFTLVREPLIFSFGALFAGCLAVSLVPLYVGYVGFSMALILLSTFVFSFFVAPVVWSVIQPKFLTRGLVEAPAGAGVRPSPVWVHARRDGEVS